MSDACLAGYQHLKGDIFSIQTQKVGTIVSIELPKSLMRLLEITPTGKDTFFINEEKEKMDAQQFSRWFIGRAKKQELRNLLIGFVSFLPLSRQKLERQSMS
ncbi:hypothetical protein HUT03_00430 [Candidatus Liberibacter africanus]|uniref:hypothetical protein n=1 Tax=Liberibacter africanus TaxID=34020 RepID=UPI00069963C7|nr:hypothetical protein [Candidatus Liberibacter africanus]QTP63622.1 hypothetical protein HUT03_00430 [Candidatus Liberibacter africanus]